MAIKKATHIVIHSKLNLAVGGKMQRMAVGDPITLDNKVGDRLIEKGFIKKIGEKATVEIGNNPADAQIAETK